MNEPEDPAWMHVLGRVLIVALVSLMIILRLWLALTMAAEKPRFVVSVTPQFSIAGESPVLLIATIRGDETEEFYCPARELWWNGERVSRAESECPPFEEREEYPRRWIYYLDRVRGVHWAVVKLLKSDRVVAQGEARWEVR